MDSPSLAPVGTVDELTLSGHWQTSTVSIISNIKSNTMNSTIWLLIIIIVWLASLKDAYVTGYAERGLIGATINIYKYQFEIFNLLYLRNAWSSLCAFLH